MINGRAYDWEDVTITLPHGVLIDVESIEYDDGRELENVYGKGHVPRGYGRGNYSANCKITVLREEYNKILDYAKRNGGALYSIPPFPITVSYGNDGERITTDRIPGCLFKKTTQRRAQNDKSLKVDLELHVTGVIEYDGVPATVSK